MIREALRLGSVRVGGLVLAMAVNIFLARLLGPTSFGAVAFHLALLTLLSSVSSGGLSPWLTKEFAAAVHDSSEPAGTARRGSLASLLYRPLVWLVVTAVLLAAVTALLVALSVTPTLQADSPTANFIVVGLLMLTGLVGTGLLAILAGVWRGVGSPVLGDLPISVAIPVVLMATLLLVPAALRGDGLMVFGVYVAVTLGVAIVSLLAVFAKGLLFSSSLSAPRTSSKFSQFGRQLLPFVGLASLGALTSQLGTLMVGLISTEEATAAYRVGERLALLVSLPLLVMNAVISSSIVRSHRSKDTASLRATLLRARKLSLLMAIPIVVIFVLFGERVLELLFGESYVSSAYPVLIILAGAQLVNVACGPVGLALTMTGHERTVFRAQLLSSVFAILLLPPAISSSGATGAAIVMALALIFWNVCLLRSEKNHVG